MATTITPISVQELCEQEGLSRSTLTQIVQYEIAEPVAGTPASDWVFDTTGGHWIKKHFASSGILSWTGWPWPCC